MMRPSKWYTFVILRVVFHLLEPEGMECADSQSSSAVRKIVTKVT